ncbi:uncharacterized protein [Temnothorax longispinosus]|uniref:uncharacterized protein n=1 Tax=Temnothorax longispinosus TaxID=300112 RepID=UPI003A990503
MFDDDESSAPPYYTLQQLQTMTQQLLHQQKQLHLQQQQQQQQQQQREQQSLSLQIKQLQRQQEQLQLQKPQQLQPQPQPGQEQPEQQLQQPSQQEQQQDKKRLRRGMGRGRARARWYSQRGRGRSWGRGRAYICVDCMVKQNADTRVMIRIEREEEGQKIVSAFFYSAEVNRSAERTRTWLVFCDGTNLKHVYNDRVNTDMSYDDFSKLCHTCWQQKYGFVVIDKDSAISNDRYRKGFNDFAIP